MKISAHGFTLIELLVVIAIMAIIGAFTLANYRSFGEEQNLKSAVLDIQSLLRQAQANATTNVICDSQYAATWQAVFSDEKIINLNCLESSTLFPKKTLKLDSKDPNIRIYSVAGPGCPTALPFTTNFTLLDGKIQFVDDTGVKPLCNSLTITLENTKTTTTKSLIIEQGGRIYGPTPPP